MRISPFIFVFIFLLIGSAGIAQQETNKDIFSIAEANLIKLSNTFIRDSILANRLEANIQFKEELQAILAQDNSFQYPFEKMEAVSILYPKDSIFRIFTWQVFINDNEYQYGGLIQLNNEKNELFELEDHSAELPPYDIEYEQMSPENWYGALYYNLHEYDSKEGKKYLLFGFDGYQFFHKRKIAEVLYFDESGQPVFGAPAFSKAAEGYDASTKNRLYLEYSADVSIRLNYDAELNILIHNHLVSMKGQYRGQGTTNVPDGSYVGYQLEDGIWQYVEKVFNAISEEPPRPAPILEGNKKDIFGNAKGTKYKKAKKNK